MDQDPNREPEVKSLMYQCCAFTRVFEVAIIKSKLTQEVAVAQRQSTRLAPTRLWVQIPRGTGLLALSAFSVELP